MEENWRERALRAERLLQEHHRFLNKPLTWLTKFCSVCNFYIHRDGALDSPLYKRDLLPSERDDDA